MSVCTFFGRGKGFLKYRYCRKLSLYKQKSLHAIGTEAFRAPDYLRRTAES